jgi:hypothetical protein
VIKVMAAACVALLAIGAPVRAQQEPETQRNQTQQPVGELQRELDELATQVDESEQAQRVSAGILRPIYSLAEKCSFPAFHWLVFAVMVVGVVSFGLQLTLGKLVVLTKLGFSPSEILADALGLVISLAGLMLTTQAAAENSGFTSSAFSVISATCVGALAGIVFFVWGQRQELQAVAGRQKAP